MRKPWLKAPLACAALVVLLGSPGFAEDPPSKPPLGFFSSTGAEELKAESRALAVPAPDKARAWLRTLTEEPHVAGTPGDYKTAVFVRDKLRDWGWDAKLVEYEVLLNYPAMAFGNPDGVPLSPSLELIQPTRKKLGITEDAIESDKDSASRTAFPAFHGYGISGNARGQVVYANYGRPEDFSALERLGIDVRDKIVLTRYGEIFRGLKVRNAQKHGARGILIYSDPGDDGYAKGDIYPDGPYRAPSAVQRGSVQFLSLGPGDPSTPFGPSVKGADRLPIDPLFGLPLPPEKLQAMNFGLGGGSHSAVPPDWEKKAGIVRGDYFAEIPSLPISYESARPILEALSGPVVPSGWQGGLPFAYHIGPGPAEVSFSTQMDYKLRTIWNVIATIKGDVEPDRWVLLSNHRDAWVYGAVDPGSGTAATMETCRAIGDAVKHGWKPRRTLVYASWDAEEYGLVGSTEWAEEHAKELDEKATLVLNVDVAVGGMDLDVDGVPSLRDWFLDALGTITDVRSGRSLKQIFLEKRRSQWAGQASLDLADPLWDEKDKGHPSRFSPKLDALGSGSDYTAFLDHLGIPCVDAGFSGRYGVYHSIYDDFTWMEKFGDPEFLTHTMAARLYTVLMMRAAAAEVLPFSFVPYGEVFRDEVDDLRRIVERRIKSTDKEFPKDGIVFEGLRPLIASIKAFQEKAGELDKATKGLTEGEEPSKDRLVRVNSALNRIERAFLMAEGLPGRPWFKHAVYAPGLTTGYASWPLPGVRQAILEGNNEMLSKQVPALIDRIKAATDAMDAALKAAK